MKLCDVIVIFDVFNTDKHIAVVRIQYVKAVYLAKTLLVTFLISMCC